MASHRFLASILAYFGTWFAQEQAQAALAPPTQSPAPLPSENETGHVVETREPKLGERGATPLHYRAFSVLAVRCEDVAMRETMVAFRNRAKTIKLQDDPFVRTEALRVMDHFAYVVDRYAAIHDDTSGSTRKDKADRMLVTMRRMDDALEAIMSSATLSADGFDSALRFVETAYDPAAAAAVADYGLTSIA